jgi:ADP-ribose pyrophosphatase YjhB (NUDIX family)
LLFYYDVPKFWSLPGGRCDLNEDSKTAIIRECKEELAETVNPKRLLAVVENFFTFADEKTHELLYVYEVGLNKDSKLLLKDEFYADEAGKPMLCKWVKLKDIKEYDVRPVVLYDLLQKPSSEIKHIIYKDS